MGEGKEEINILSDPPVKEWSDEIVGTIEKEMDKRARSMQNRVYHDVRLLNEKIYELERIKSENEEEISALKRSLNWEVKNEEENKKRKENMEKYIQYILEYV